MDLDLEIKQVIDDNPGLTRAEIARHLASLVEAQVPRDLKRLADDNEILETGEGVKGSPFTYRSHPITRRKLNHA